MLEERKKAGENLGFDPTTWPARSALDQPDRRPGHAVRRPPAARPVRRLQQPALRWRSSAAPSATPARAAPPTSTSPSHTPNDARQRREWEKEHDWEPIHDWDFPMLSSRFVESSCLKCHHQVTDLIRHGSKEEAPKLLRGLQPRPRTAASAATRSPASRAAGRSAPTCGWSRRRPLDWLTPPSRSGPRPTRQPAGRPAQGRPQPAPPRREDQRGVDAQVDQLAARASGPTPRCRTSTT